MVREQLYLWREPDMPEAIFSDYVEAEPVLIKAYVDGLTFVSLIDVHIEIYGQKALVVVHANVV
jgi:hypothetical protein